MRGSNRMKYIWRVPVEGANIFVNAKHVSETLNLTKTTRGASLNESTAFQLLFVTMEKWIFYKNFINTMNN